MNVGAFGKILPVSVVSVFVGRDLSIIEKIPNVDLTKYCRFLCEFAQQD